jgi:hypothetical protein
MTDPFTYDYTIPDNIPAGNATIAWSWMNRVGNREFYMECGVLELTGTGGDQANFDALPDLFVANVVPYDGGCVTDDMQGSDPLIPNPGDSVETNSAYPAVAFNSACVSLSATGGSGSSPTSYAASSAQSTSAAATSYATSAASSAQGGVFITKTGASSAAQATTTAQATTATTKATSVAETTSAAPAATSASSSGSTSGSQKTGACDTDGVFSK